MNRVRPCSRCGNLMAPRGKHQALGVRRVYNQTLCTSCAHWLRAARLKGRYRAGRPTWDVDEIAVERLIDGSLRQQPTYGELHAAIVALDRHGMSAYQIAERLGCSVRTVVRHRGVVRRAATGAERVA